MKRHQNDRDDNPVPNKKQKIGSEAQNTTEILSFIEDNQNVLQIIHENTKNPAAELDDSLQLSTSLAQFIKSVQNDAFDIDFVVRTVSKAKQNKDLNRKKFIKQLIEAPTPLTDLSILFYLSNSGIFTVKEYLLALDAKYYKSISKNLSELFNKKNFEVFDEILRQCIELSFNEEDRSTIFFSELMPLFDFQNVFNNEDSFGLAKHCIDVVKSCAVSLADNFLLLLWTKLMAGTKDKENLLEVFYNILDRKKNATIIEAIVSPFHGLLFDEFVLYFHEGSIIDTIFDLIKSNDIKWSIALIFLLYLNESTAPFTGPVLKRFSQLTQELLTFAIDNDSNVCLQACIIIVYILSSRAEETDQLQTYSNWFKRNFIEDPTSVLKTKKSRQLLITSLEAIVHTKDFYLLQIHSNLVDRIPKIRNLASAFIAKSKSGLFNWDKQFSFRHLFPRTEHMPSSQQNQNIVNKVSSIASRDPAAIAFKAVKKYQQTSEIPQFVLQMRILNPKFFLDSFAPALKKLSNETVASSQNAARTAEKLLKHLVTLKHVPQRVLLDDTSTDDDVMIVENSFDISVQLDDDQATLQDLNQLLSKKDFKSIGERLANNPKLSLLIDWLIKIAPDHSTEISALNSIVEPLIKNNKNLPVLESELKKKLRESIDGCSLFLALVGFLANKHKINTEIVDNLFRSFSLTTTQGLKEFTAFSLYYLNHMAVITKRNNEGFLPTFVFQHLFWIYKRMKAYIKDQKVEFMKYTYLWQDLAAVFEKNGFSQSYSYRSNSLANSIPLKKWISLELAFEDSETEIPGISSITGYINQMIRISLKGEFSSSIEKITSFLLMELLQRECNKTEVLYSTYANSFLLLIEQKLRELFLQLSPTKLPSGWLADRLLEVTKLYATDKHVKLLANFICLIIPPNIFFNSLQLKRRVMEMSHSKQNFSDLFSLYLHSDYIYEAVESSNIEYKELQSCLVDHTTVVRVLFRNWKNVKSRDSNATNGLFKFVAALYDFVYYVLYSAEPLEKEIIAKMIKANEFLVFDSIITSLLNIEVPSEDTTNAYPLLFDHHVGENSKVIEELFTNRLVPFVQVLSKHFNEQFTEFFGQILRRLELHIQKEGFDELGLFLLSKLIQISFTIQPDLIVNLDQSPATQQLLFFASIVQLDEQIQVDFSEETSADWLSVLLKMFLSLLPADVALPTFLSFNKKALMDQVTHVIKFLVESANMTAVQSIDVDVKIELQDLLPTVYEAIVNKLQ